jgi:hypothetical protein
MSAAIHEVQFHKNRQTGMHRAICSCGWFHHSMSLQECQERASGHDVAWECVAVDPLPAGVGAA